MKERGENIHLEGARSTNFYYSFVLLPAEKRRAIRAIHAFARRCDDAVDSGLPPIDARRALADCRRELDRCYEVSEGSSAEIPPQTAPLARAITRFSIPREPFDDLMAGLEMDLSVARYETFDDLAAYCYRVASTIGLISIEVLGYRRKETRTYAIHLGMALQLVNILRDIANDARRGRLYVPLEDLRRFEVDPQSLLDGRPVGNMDALLDFEVQRAREQFARARQSLAEEDRRSLRAAEIMAAIYWRILNLIAQRKSRSLTERIHLSTGRKVATALSVYLGFDWYDQDRAIR